MSVHPKLTFVRHPHAGEPISISILDGDLETTAELTPTHALRLAGDLIAAALREGGLLASRDAVLYAASPDDKA